MKTKITFLFLFISFGILSCNSDKIKKSYSTEIIEDSNSITNSISSTKNINQIYQIPLPSNYIRKEVSSTSFAYYLRHISLKPKDTPVKLYNGELKYVSDVHYRVLDISVGTRDLQQCADAVMRLRAEYLFKTNQKDKISFNYTSGDAAVYTKWKDGYRPQINGNKVSWILKAKTDTTYSNFLNYLENVFMYAGSSSLSKELKSKNITELEIGDVLIKGGFPGHAVIVVDVAINSQTNKKIFMIAQSYMPAQDIHILKNFSANSNNESISPWYEIPTNKLDKIYTPEWIFEQTDLKSFD